MSVFNYQSHQVQVLISKGDGGYKWIIFINGEVVLPSYEAIHVFSTTHEAMEAGLAFAKAEIDQVMGSSNRS